MKSQSEVKFQAIGKAVRVLLVGALLSLGPAPSLRAGPITTYTYTGSAFTVFGGTDVGACPPECNLSGSFTVSNPLAGGLTNAAITPTSFMFTDGSTAVLTNTNTTGTGDEASFQITTNGAGVIIAWDINLEDVSVALMESYNGNCSGTPFDESWNAPLTGFNNFAQWQGTGGCPSGGTWVSSNPSTTTPEPTTLMTLSTGLLGLGIMRLRRKQIASSLRCRFKPANKQA